MSAHSSSNAAWRRRAKAVIWAARLEHGRLTAYQRCMLEVWRANDENALELAWAQHVFNEIPAVLPAVVPVRRSPSASQIFECFKSWRWDVISSGVVATLLVALTLWWNPQASQSGQVQVIETQAEASPDIALADRSVVSLRPGSRMRFEMNEARRLVHEPQGEIFFDVAKDPKRPFIVSMGKHYIRAVGTRFAVRRYDGEPSVVVQEGIVAVRRDGREVHVKAGEQLKIVASGDLIVQQVDVKKALAWTRKLVNVSGKTLGEVIAALNRRNQVQIEIVDDQIASEVLSLGDFYLDDPEFFVEALAERGKVVVEHSGPNTLRLLTVSRPGTGGR